MTLLKKLQEESKEELRQYFDKHLKAKKETMKNLDRELLADYFAKQTANTVTAVLDEIEREVEIAQGANTENTIIGVTSQFLVNDALTDIKAIIQSKRTEI